MFYEPTLYRRAAPSFIVLIFTFVLCCAPKNLHYLVIKILLKSSFQFLLFTIDCFQGKANLARLAHLEHQAPLEPLDHQARQVDQVITIIYIQIVVESRTCSLNCKLGYGFWCGFYHINF